MRNRDNDFRAAIHALENLEIDLDDAPDMEIDADTIVEAVTENLSSAISEALEQATERMTGAIDNYKSDVEDKMSSIQSAIDDAKDALENAAETFEDLNEQIEKVKDENAMLLKAECECLIAAKDKLRTVPDTMQPAFDRFMEGIGIATGLTSKAIVSLSWDAGVLQVTMTLANEDVGRVRQTLELPAKVG